MGIQSAINLSDTVVNGVTLGEPAITETGAYHWDGGVPEGTVTDLGVFKAPAGSLEADRPVTDLARITFPKWVQPVGASDAYKAKTVVQDDKDVLWVSLIDANVWAPGVSGWRRFSENPATILPWVQPTGAHDAYKLNATVSFGGFNWKNTGSDANVWQPGVFGWVKI